MSGHLTCKSCGKAVAAGDRFCASCGTAITLADRTARVKAPEVGTNATQCVRCGSPMERADGFCPQCGAARPEDPTVVSRVSLRNAQATRLIEATQGEFEILDQLGTGAMGAVYLAEDVALGRQVAIKVIAPHLLSDDSMVSRFRMEAKTVAALRHPNIVNVHAVRQSGDLHYFVMEFIDGPPLRSLVKSHAPLDVDVVQSIIFQVGSALGYAHRSRGGVIHRDVKPANIMVDREGDAFVTDFGISKIAQSQTGLTQTGATIGTPEYMSPEQCRGEALTGASDQYALGIVAYEMLCGHTPFGGTQYHIMVAHTTEPPKPIQEVRPDCPPYVAEAVERMLAKSPEQRWPDLDSAVMAMGGAPLGYHDPIRQKIKGLTVGMLTHLHTIGAGSRSGGGSGGGATLDTATSVTVLGVPNVFETGERVQLHADVRGTGNASLSGQGIVWASTDPSIAKVDGGWVEGLRPGTVSIMASAGPVASSVVLTVAEPAPAKVVVRPISVRIQRGGSIGLSAVVQDKRGRPLDREVRWMSSNPQVATVSEAGIVQATGRGEVRVTAQAEGVSGSAAIVVEALGRATGTAVDAPPAGGDAPAAVRAPTPGQEEGPALGPSAAEAPPAEKAVADQPAIVKPAGWRQRTVPARSRAAAASEGPAGRRPLARIAVLVLLVGVGVVGVRAFAGGGGDVVTRPSQPSPDPTREADPIVPEASVAEGLDATPGAATSGDPDSPAPQPEAATTSPVSQPPSPPPAQVTSGGGAGGAGGGGGGAPPSTPPPTPERIAVTANRSMEVGGTQTASAQVFASGNTLMRLGYTLSWRSSDAAVFSVDPRSGAVRASMPGAAWLVASAGDARDSIRLTIAAAASEVRIAEEDFTLEAWAPARALGASVLDSGGNAVQRTVAWSSSDDAVATVDASGRVSAVAAGTARITAAAAGFSDQITVRVTEPGVVPSDAQVRAAVDAYVSALGRGSRDLVTRLWGSADAGRLEELLDLMGQRDFSAQLGTVGSASQSGSGSVLTFQVRAAWRSNFGQNRTRDMGFVGRLERVGSEWQLVSSVIQ